MDCRLTHSVAGLCMRLARTLSEIIIILHFAPHLIISGIAVAMQVILQTILLSRFVRPYRELRRLQDSSLTPLIAHNNECLRGLCELRAFA
jgi:hypothetical protein